MRPASSVTPAKGNATSKFSKLEKYRKSYRYSDGEWAASYDGDTAPFIYSSLRENEESFDLPGARWNNGKDAAQGDGNFEPVWQKLKDGWKSQEEASKSVEVISTDRREFDRRLNLGEQCLRIHSSRRSGYTDPSKVPVTMYGRGMSNKTEKLYDSLLIPKKEKARRALLRFSSLSTKQKQRLLNMMPMDPPPEAANKVKLFKRDTASAMAYYKMKKEKRAEAVQEQLWMSKSQRRASISFMHLGANGSRMPRRKRLTPLEIEAEEQAAEINAIASAHQEKRLEFYDEFRQVSEGKLRGNRGNGDTASYDDFDTDDSKYTSFIEDLDDKRLPPEPLPLRLLNNSVKHSSAFSETDDSETETEDNEGTRGRKVGLGIGLAHFGIGNERGAALSKAMQELTDLKEVNLSDNRLGDDTVCKLLLAMRQNHHLRKLDLSSNVVGASSFGVLMPLLWDTSSNLTDLSLHDCKVGQSQIQQMVRALSGAEGQSRQMQLTKLDLSRNRIGAAGAEQLAILLQKRTCNISDLNLSWNSIQKHGVAALGEALQRKFCPLKKLDLAFNQLGHDTMHIAEALRENTSLEELDISQNHFKGESTLVLAQMLSMNTTLQKLKLSGNLIGEDGGRAIMRAVMGDVCNCEVNMQGCSYPCDEDAFDPQVPCKNSPYSMRFSSPYDRAVFDELCKIVRIGRGSMRQVQRGDEDDVGARTSGGGGGGDSGGSSGGDKGKGKKGKGGKEAAAPSRATAAPKVAKLHHEADITANQLGILGTKGSTLPVHGKILFNFKHRRLPMSDDKLHLRSSEGLQRAVAMINSGTTLLERKKLLGLALCDCAIMPLQAKWLLSAVKLSKVEVLAIVAPCLNRINFDKEGANAKATAASGKANLVAHKAALSAQESLDRALKVVLPAVWDGMCESHLKDLSDEVKESAAKYALEHEGRLVPRQDMGKFNRSAVIAVISAPCAVADATRVRLRADDTVLGRLKAKVGAEPVKLEDGVTYTVTFEHPIDDSGVMTKQVDGSNLKFAELSEYDWWYHAVAKTKMKCMRGTRKRFSFACVFLPGMTGHCTDVDKCKGGKRVPCAQFMCHELGKAYDCSPPAPRCGSCAWTEPWCANVMLCAADGQELCFAYLDVPTFLGQPQFECTAPGYEGKYYVGIAQKVELDWAQNQMGYFVKPIRRMSLVADKLADDSREGATQIMRSMEVANMARHLVRRMSQKNLETGISIEVAHRACTYWEHSGVPGVQDLEVDTAAIVQKTRALVEHCEEEKQVKLKKKISDMTSESKNQFSTFELIFNTLPSDEFALMVQMVGQTGYKFNVQNPTGHWVLELTNVMHKEMALAFAAINTAQTASSKKKSGRGDTSQHGNWSCFRNEFFNGSPTVLEPDFFDKLPRAGTLEFDFVSFKRPPPTAVPLDFFELPAVFEAIGVQTAKTRMLARQLQKKRQEEDLRKQRATAGKAAGRKRRPGDQGGRPPANMGGEAFTREPRRGSLVGAGGHNAFAHMSATADIELAVSPTTMLSHLHLLGSEKYFTCFLVLKIFERLCEFVSTPSSVIVSLFSRIVDLENFDIILGAVPAAVGNDLVNRLGWLNLFSPLKPYGAYSLNLERVDEWVFMKLALDLAASADLHDVVADTAFGSAPLYGSDYGIPDLYAKKANLPKVGKVHFKIIKEKGEKDGKEEEANVSEKHQMKMKAKVLAARKLCQKQSLPFLKYVLLGTKPISKQLHQLPIPGEKLIKSEQARNHLQLVSKSFLKKKSAKSTVSGWLSKPEVKERPRLSEERAGDSKMQKMVRRASLAKFEGKI